jgi:hypothetical protein
MYVLFQLAAAVLCMYCSNWRQLCYVYIVPPGDSYVMYVMFHTAQYEAHFTLVDITSK